MFTAMTDAEIACHPVELLPARTVLSMRSAGIQDILGGNNGTAGNAGNTGQTPGWDLLGLMNQPGTAAAGAAAAGTNPG